MRRVPTAVWIAALVAACQPTRATPDRPAAPAATARRFEPRPLDTLWRATFADSSATPMPEYIVADDANVYVGDLSTRTIVALDARTGAPRWIRAASTDSTLAAPRALANRRGGGVLLFDTQRRAILGLAPDGRVVARTPLPTIEDARSLCQLGDGSLVIAVPGGAHAVVRFAPSGQPLGAYALPWPELATRSTLASTVTLTPTHGGCVAALAYARGFAELVDGAFGTPVAYVEPFAPIVVNVTRREVPGGWIVSEAVAEHVTAAIDVAATSREILVAFDGRTRDRAHLIDVYDSAGTYQLSYRTARRIDALAASDSAVFVLTKVAGLPTLVALKRPTQR